MSITQNPEMTAPSLLQLPEEILARIVCNIADPWQVEIRTRLDRLIEDYYDEPRSCVTPGSVPLAPLLVCKELSRIARYSLLDLFSGTISILDTTNIEILPPKWQPIQSRIRELVVPSHRLHFLNRSMPLIRSLPKLRNIEFVECLKMYFPVDLNQLDSKGRFVPAEPDEVADGHLIDLARQYTPGWPAVAAGCDVLRGVEIVFHADFFFRYQNKSRNYDVAFLIGEGGVIARVKDRRLIRGG